MKRGRFLPLFIVVFFLLIPSGAQFSENANAASACSLTGQTTPEWGEDAELIETGNNQIKGEDFFFSEAFSIGGDLDPLTNGFVTSVNVSDQAYTAIRMKMVEGYRYTFCVSFASAPNQTVSGDPLADVYLMENLDYDRYRWDDTFDEEENVSPSLFSFFGWIPYRDIHAYENTRNIDFSVTFEDGGSSSSQGIFGSGNDDSMYLVLDAKNNSRSNDAPSRGQNMVAQIVVLVEERVLLPKTSVYMICCSLPLMVILAPIFIHQKYAKGDWDDSGVELELMPMVENSQNIPIAYRNED